MGRANLARPVSRRYRLGGEVIKLLLMLLGTRTTKLMFLHRPCGSARALTSAEQRELLTEVRQTPADGFRGRAAALLPLPVFVGDNLLLNPEWGMIALAL